MKYKAIKKIKKFFLEVKGQRLPVSSLSTAKGLLSRMEENGHRGRTVTVEETWIKTQGQDWKLERSEEC